MTDPTHPLYGQRFRVLSVSQPPQAQGHVIVAYRDFMRLRLPLAATSLAPVPTGSLRSKLTLAAVRELLALVQECPSCPRRRKRSGPGSPQP